MYDVIAGIDWASREHAVFIGDRHGKRLDRFIADHTEDGLERLLQRLACAAEPGATMVAIERPDGLLVDRLLEAGHPVLPVKPAAVRAYRTSVVPSGAKSDQGDAKVIAEYARLAGGDRVLQPYSDRIRSLRLATRTRTQLVRRRVRATNQLGDVLGQHWPGAAATFDLNTDIASAFLHRYPTPDAASHLGPKRMRAFLDRVGYSGKWRRTADELLESIRAAPATTTSPLFDDRLESVVIAHLHVLDGLRGQIKQLDRVIAAQLDQHPDGPIFSSFPHSGTISAAQMLAEWGCTRSAYPTADAAASLAGLTPVTRASGTHRAVVARWACNKWMRQAFTTYADNSRRGSSWAAHTYRNAINRGCDHPHAIRILGRAWTRVIWRCWSNRQPYDPAKHRNARALTTA